MRTLLAACLLIAGMTPALALEIHNETGQTITKVESRVGSFPGRWFTLVEPAFRVDQILSLTPTDYCKRDLRFTKADGTSTVIPQIDICGNEILFVMN